MTQKQLDRLMLGLPKYPDEISSLRNELLVEQRKRIIAEAKIQQLESQLEKSEATKKLYETAILNQIAYPLSNTVLNSER